MCGFAGFLTVEAGRFGAETKTIVRKMAESISHRGPDSHGFWLDPNGFVALGHRRLSILDVSPAGAQPMVSRTGRFVMVFNGEVYNHSELRDELESNTAWAIRWCGHSDTETVLYGIEEWGLEKTLKKCNGMFALALWDRKYCILSLARDRLGEKPLYYGWQGRLQQRVFLFGSELSALRVHPSFVSHLDHDALALFTRYGCIGGPSSIYRNIFKLEPGKLLTLSLAEHEPKITTWWCAIEVALRGSCSPFSGSTADAVDALEDLLRNSVKQQMVSDVPVGAFLSGGVDSSTVVAMMQSQSSRAVQTFSLGFAEIDYDEAGHARAVARHLGTVHTEMYVSAQQALDLIVALPKLYSEPFADSSQVPMCLVSQLARQSVTVALSGDGGDELFGGYTRYLITAGLWNKLSRIPRPLRILIARLLVSLRPQAWDAIARPFFLKRVGDKVHKGAALMGSRSTIDLYHGMVSQWSNDLEIVSDAGERATSFTRFLPMLKDLSDVERMMILDLLTYLPDDILTKVDRASMGVGLETRVPFLDHRVVEFAWSLPENLKIRKGVGKWPLRQVLNRYVPSRLIERPKMGFGLPISSWLRGPLRIWAEGLLDERRLREEGYFDATIVRKVWGEHLSGRRNWQYHIWTVLMFQGWLEEQKQPPSSVEA